MVECVGATGQPQRGVVRAFLVRHRGGHGLQVTRRIRQGQRADQAGEALGGRVLVEARTRQAVGDGVLQRQQAIGEPAPVASGTRQAVRFEQGIAQCKRFGVCGRAGTIAQQRLHQMVAPGLRQELADRTRHWFVEQVMHGVVGLGARLVEAFAAEGGLGRARFLQFDPAAMLFEQCFELGMGRGEHRKIFLVIGHDALGDGRAALDQFAILRRGSGVALAGLGDGVEQPARRMLALHEYALVRHRDLDVRHHQAAIEAARMVEQRVALEQRLEQHADEVDGVVLVRAHAGVLGIVSETTRTLGELPADR